MKIVLITGMSGSGKSVTLNVLEDAGYYCVDNLLPELLPMLLAQLHDVATLAVAIDARSARYLEKLPQTLTNISQAGNEVKVLFLDASDHAITQRFSETRRRHPLSIRNAANAPSTNAPSLPECIAAERQLLSVIGDLGHRIDTSTLGANQLREWIKNWLEASDGSAYRALGLTLCLMSFGFKYGLPHEADFVFDVRTLPNPYYDLVLRAQSGKDVAVQQFLAGYPEVQETIDDIAAYLNKRFAAFTRDTRSYLTVAIGCTGGQHRSVYIVQQLQQLFSAQEPLLIRHRDCVDTQT